MMEAAGASETSIKFYHTAWHNIQEDSHLCVCPGRKSFHSSLIEAEMLVKWQS
jgi:hypothetical protein